MGRIRDWLRSMSWSDKEKKRREETVVRVKSVRERWKDRIDKVRRALSEARKERGKMAQKRRWRLRREERKLMGARVRAKRGSQKGDSKGAFGKGQKADHVIDPGHDDATRLPQKRRRDDQGRLLPEFRKERNRGKKQRRAA